MNERFGDDTLFPRACNRCMASLQCSFTLVASGGVWSWSVDGAALGAERSGLWLLLGSSMEASCAAGRERDARTGLLRQRLARQLCRLLLRVCQWLQLRALQWMLASWQMRHHPRCLGLVARRRRAPKRRRASGERRASRLCRRQGCAYHHSWQPRRPKSRRHLCRAAGMPMSLTAPPAFRMVPSSTVCDRRQRMVMGSHP